MLPSFISIGISAALGAWLRWWFGIKLDALFPLIPLGTLTANLVGGFFMGIFMGITQNHLFIPPHIRLGVVTGFLGGLTTFSTFSAETVSLIANHEYFWTGVIILGHVGGTIFSTILGIYTIKYFVS